MDDGSAATFDYDDTGVGVLTPQPIPQVFVGTLDCTTPPCAAELAGQIREHLQFLVLVLLNPCGVTEFITGLKVDGMAFLLFQIQEQTRVGHWLMLQVIRK